MSAVGATSGLGRHSAAADANQAARIARMSKRERQSAMIEAYAETLEPGEWRDPRVQASIASGSRASSAWLQEPLPPRPLPPPVGAGRTSLVGPRPPTVYEAEIDAEAGALLSALSPRHGKDVEEDDLTLLIAAVDEVRT